MTSSEIFVALTSSHQDSKAVYTNQTFVDWMNIKIIPTTTFTLALNVNFIFTVNHQIPHLMDTSSVPSPKPFLTSVIIPTPSSQMLGA